MTDFCLVSVLNQYFTFCCMAVVLIFRIKQTCLNMHVASKMRHCQTLCAILIPFSSVDYTTDMMRERVDHVSLGNAVLPHFSSKTLTSQAFCYISRQVQIFVRHDISFLAHLHYDMETCNVPRVESFRYKTTVIREPTTLTVVYLLLFSFPIFSPLFLVAP